MYYLGRYNAIFTFSKDWSVSRVAIVHDSWSEDNFWPWKQMLWGSISPLWWTGPQDNNGHCSVYFPFHEVYLVYYYERRTFCNFESFSPYRVQILISVSPRKEWWKVALVVIIDLENYIVDDFIKIIDFWLTISQWRSYYCADLSCLWIRIVHASLPNIALHERHWK